MASKDGVAELLHKAQAAIHQRHHQEARAFFLRALEHEPDHPDAHYGLATVCFQQGDMLGAVHHFREVTRHDPQRAGAFVNLGALYNHLGREEDAISALKRGIHLNPQRAEGYYNLGLVYRKANHLGQAVAAYQEAVRIQPGLAEAHFNLANILLETEHFADAITQYREALKTRPDWAAAKQGLAIAEEALADEIAPAIEAQPTAPAAAPLDPTKLIDPNVHGHELAEIHAAVAEAETLGKKIGIDISPVLDAAIKDLSQCFLRPDTPGYQLARRIETFDSSAKTLETAQRSLEQLCGKLQKLGKSLTSG